MSQRMFLTTFMVLYLVIVAAVGIYFSRRGGKGLSTRRWLGTEKTLRWWQVYALCCGAWVTGGYLTSTPQYAWSSGVSTMLIGGLPVGTALIISAFVLAGPFQALKGYTIGEFAEKLFSSKAVRAAVGIILFCAYCWMGGLNVVMGGVVISQATGLSLKLSELIIAIIPVAIVITGGIIAVTASNLIHLLVFFPGIIIAAIFSLSAVGGWAGLNAALPAEPYFNLFYKPGFIGAGWVSFMPGVFVAQSAILALFMARTKRDAKIGALAAGITVILCQVFGVIIGMSAKVAIPDLALYGLRAGPAMLFHGGLPLPVIALALSATLAMVLSTMCPNLFAIVQMLVRDIIPTFKRDPMTDRQLFWTTRGMSVAYGVIAWITGMYIFKILVASIFILGIRSGLIFVILWGIIAKNFVSGKAAVVAIVASEALYLTWHYALVDPFGIHPVYLLVSSALILTPICAKIWPRKTFMDEDFEKLLKGA